MTDAVNNVTEEMTEEKLKRAYYKYLRENLFL